MAYGEIDVTCRPDEIAKAMVVSALSASRGNHASMVTSLALCRKCMSESCSFSAGPSDENSRRKLPNVMVNCTAEFSERADGYPGVRKAYGFGFSKVHDLEPSLMYQAVATGEVDVICAFTTDGRIAAYDLQPLVDNRRFFPPYFAAPVIRSGLLQGHPEVRTILAQLAGVFDDETMQRLNHEVDEKGGQPRGVAHDFLLKHGLLNRN